jgi:hypothetical protein
MMYGQKKDDNTTGTVSALKTILDDFALFSGLKYHVDKTALMPVGRKIVISPEFNTLY